MKKNYIALIAIAIGKITIPVGAAVNDLSEQQIETLLANGSIAESDLTPPQNSDESTAGSAAPKPLDAHTVVELKAFAKAAGVEGYSNLSKVDLIAALTVPAENADAEKTEQQ